jgi:hypothetical protein
MWAGGRALIPKNVFGWPTLCGFLHLPALAGCVFCTPVVFTGANGGAVLPSFFLISIFLFSKFRKLQAGACRAASLAAD